MKPVRIDFIPNRDWVAVWIATAVVVVAGLGWLAWECVPMYRATVEARQRVQELDRQIAQLRQPRVEEVNPRYESGKQALRVLQADLNKVFATVENLTLPGARLRALDLDVTGDSVRVEYELKSVADASEVSQLLNAGYDSRPWRLGSVVLSQGGSNTQPAPVEKTARAVWTVRFSDL